jgi:transcriptional antiterminator
MTDTPMVRKDGQHLSDIQIAFVLAFDKVKVTQRNIASLVKCSRKAVRNALANYTFETFQGRHERREYQRKTTEHEDRYIERALKQFNDLPLRDITNILPVKISETTLRRRRSEIGLGSFIASEKPGLRSENVEARLRWH